MLALPDLQHIQCVIACNAAQAAFEPLAMKKRPSLKSTRQTKAFPLANATPANPPMIAPAGPVSPPAIAPAATPPTIPPAARPLILTLPSAATVLIRMIDVAGTISKPPRDFKINSSLTATLLRLKLPDRIRSFIFHLPETRVVLKL